MSKIFVIAGGGQKIRQNIQMGVATEFYIVENSDWPEKAKAYGQNLFTNYLWATDFESVQMWADEWAGEPVELVEIEKPVF